MLKLFFFTQDTRLKVREAFPHEDFSRSCDWNGKIRYQVTEDSSFMMVWTSFLPDLDPEYAETLVELVSARYPVSPKFDDLKATCEALSFKLTTDEWVFFGGSFNPWHQGHQSCISLLPDDKTCFILPDINPQKEIRELSPVATILEISSNAKLKGKQFIVPTFLLGNKKNPTIEWIEKVKNLYPTQKLSLLMGFDSFSQLKTWVRSDELLPKLHTIYVASRLEDAEDRRQALDEVHAVGPHLNVVFLGNHEHEDVSSTEIRLARN